MGGWKDGVLGHRFLPPGIPSKLLQSLFGGLSCVDGVSLD